VSNSAQPDPLQPALERAQAELAKHLDEACETPTESVSQSSPEELLRLEEELLAAARAADEAARIRRRLEQRNSGERAVSGGAGTGRSTADSTTRVAAGSASAPSPAPEEPGGRVREFRDRQGQAWRVWEVRPGIDRPLRDLHRYLGAYVNGWLAFGCLDNELRKRLPKYPPDWLQMSDRELEALLNSAVDVPPRKSARKVEGSAGGNG
jgi:hypothetical protein